MTLKEIDYFMGEAMSEGLKAKPNCFPNPPVGCVIVKDGQIVSRGYTNEPGKHHAEAMALHQLPRGVEDFIMFVTLEPCSFFGRTPSCAKHIARTSCKAVYVGMIDPHTKNSGKGIEILKNAEIEVHVGIREEEVREQLSPYLIQE
ncbi:MAG: bifunctional diaminohydroxyphosphoribosylaminopyrimidine deaminase/5-amino-6-(5-phosphoribosylamino)uracil reductase RibD [Bacteroidota bacterium]